MSTAMTATLPNLEYSSDPASGSLHGLPTMPFGALAWSLAEPEKAEEPLAPNLIPAAPLASTRPPKSTRSALVAVVFGGVTVAAALGAILLGGSDEPSTPPAVVDHTRSTPYVAPAAAPMPTVRAACRRPCGGGRPGRAPRGTRWSAPRRGGFRGGCG